MASSKSNSSSSASSLPPAPRRSRCGMPLCWKKLIKQRRSIARRLLLRSQSNESDHVLATDSMEVL